MKDKALRILALGMLCALLALVASGCVFQPVDSLYALPALPEEYSDLQTGIQTVIDELGAEYATINYGSNTSTVQLLDMDGDGTQETAAVFLRVLAAEERPLRVCLFRRDSDNSYERSYILEGEGTSINSVAYVDLTGDGYRELVISWQMSAGVHSLTAYALTDTEGNELMSTSYNETYITADLDQDGDQEILVFQQDGSGEGSHRAEYYDFREGIMTLASSTPLSQGMRDVVSAGTGRLADGSMGVYATLEIEGGQLTDVLTLEGGGLVNVTRDPDSGISQSTFREYTEVAVSDINNDQVMEVPMPVPLTPLDRESASLQYLIYWRQFDREGTAAVSCVTYHSNTDGWYLVLPDSWAGNVTVTRDDNLSNRGERAVVFCYRPGLEEEPVPFLTIYRLTGNNREARARLSGRFILYRGSSTIYAASLNTEVWECGADQTELTQRFNIITAEWSSQ